MSKKVDIKLNQPAPKTDESVIRWIGDGKYLQTPEEVQFDNEARYDPRTPAGRKRIDELFAQLREGDEEKETRKIWGFYMKGDQRPVAETEGLDNPIERWDLITLGNDPDEKWVVLEVEINQMYSDRLWFYHRYIIERFDPEKHERAANPVRY